MIDFNYAKAGETEDWMDIICVDVETNCEIFVAEVNCAEGWAVILTRVLGKSNYIAERIPGHFRLMGMRAAKKLGVKIQ